MRQPNGHSNCYPDETTPYPTNPERASVPLVGGSNVNNTRPLPPLSLSRKEWAEIGRRMGWLLEAAADWLVAGLGLEE